MWIAGGCASQAMRAMQNRMIFSAFRHTLLQQVRRTRLHTRASVLLHTQQNGTCRGGFPFASCHNGSDLVHVNQWNSFLVRSLRTSTKCFSSETKDASKGELVYRGNLTGLIRGVKIFSLSTSLLGLCLQPYLFLNNEGLPIALKFMLGGIVNFFIFINPFIIHYIAKKYVTDIHWNRETGVFTAAKLNFLVQRKEIQFTADDVTIPDIPGMFTVLEVKGTPLFIIPQDYLSQEAYVHLMGYDKPLDWELPKKDKEKEKMRN